MNDYIKTMGQMIGHKTLLTIGCGAIIEDDRGCILLQKRADGDVWGIPEVSWKSQKPLRTLLKGKFEETNLILNNITLFGLYSGKNGFAEYSNGDKVYSVQLIFYSCDYSTLQINDESSELYFLSKDEIPLNLNPHQSS